VFRVSACALTVYFQLDGADDGRQTWYAGEALERCAVVAGSGPVVDCPPPAGQRHRAQSSLARVPPQSCRRRRRHRGAGSRRFRPVVDQQLEPRPRVAADRRTAQRRRSTLDQVDDRRTRLQRRAVGPVEHRRMSTYPNQFHRSLTT